MRIALVLLFLLCGVGAFGADLNYPKKETNTAKQRTQNIQRGSEESPLFVNIRNHERKPEKDEKHWYDDLDKNRFLLIVAILQAVVFAYQAVCLRDTVKATKEAANAAKKSSDVLPLIERAYVNVSVGIEKGEIIITFKNHGRTPATLTKFYSDIAIRDTKPKEIDEGSEHLIPPGIVIGPDELHRWPTTSMAQYRIGKSKGVKFDWSKYRLICFGRIEYLDVIKDHRTTTFCWEFSRSNKSFRISHHETLNQTT